MADETNIATTPEGGGAEPTSDAERVSNAIAALRAHDEEGQDGAEDAAQAPEEPKPAKESPLYARLAKQDRELQELRQRAKGSVRLDDLKRDPKAAIETIGLTPADMLDIWLGATDDQPATEGRRAPERTPDEIRLLRQEIENLKRSQQQRETGAMYSQALDAVRVNVEREDTPYEYIHAYRDMPIDGQKTPYDVVLETAMILGQKNPGTGPQALLETALESVERYLEQDHAARHERASKTRKWSSKQLPAKTVSREARHHGVPTNLAGDTPSEKPLTDAQRKANAIAALKRLDREGK